MSICLTSPAYLLDLQADFEKEGFSDRTVIICDQCEREYHVGCLRSVGRCTLNSLPEGEWYCSSECSQIRQKMNGLVAEGEKPLVTAARHPAEVVIVPEAPVPRVGAPSHVGEAGVPSESQIPGSTLDRTSEYTLQYLRGKGDAASASTSRSLKQVQDVLQASTLLRPMPL